MSSDQITIFILGIGMMLTAAKLLGEMFNKIHQPAVIGEIIAGIILGPTVFGMISPDTFNVLFPSTGPLAVALQGITTLAVVLLLLVSGLEVDLSTVLSQRRTAMTTGFFGIIAPFSLGFLVSYFLPHFMGAQDDSSKLAFALFIGTALSISALPVIAKTLMDLNIFKSHIGMIIISAAMFNDLIGWLVFSLILGMIGGSGHGMSFSGTIITTFVFVIVVLLVGRKIFDKILKWVQNKLSFPGAVLNFIIIAGLAGAAFTEYIGVHAILGSFIVGIAIGDSVHLKERTRELIQQFITNIFAPLFFVSIGLRVNFIANFDLFITLLILVLGFSGKIVGCTFGARISGISKNESLAIGFGLNSIGTMGIILGILALEYGLIHENIFVALVIMALITSVTSAPMMKYFLGKRDESTIGYLLKRKLFFFSDAENKSGLLDQLIDKAAEETKTDKGEISKRVYQREAVLTTGLENYLAIPHARIKYTRPLVVAAYSRNGIDFGANDGAPSRIIFLLLTPESKNELQLQLLSEIVKKFRNRSEVEEVMKQKNEDEFFEALKKL